MISVMKTQKQCPACASPVPLDARGGLCPFCLLGLADSSADLRARADAAALWPEPDASSPTTSGDLPCFGDYELLNEVARGGMGVVYRARHRGLDRVVALKMVLLGQFSGSDAQQRFRAEAQTAARLKHPRIVAIHDIGTLDGQPYFTMDLVDGPNLAEAIRAEPCSPRRAAELLGAIVEAVAYAHREGVLHRDIKPSNILLDSNGQPHLTDFGLARQIDSDSSLTLTGQALGSPNYMAPEQAVGASDVTVAADLWSLGAILYHLLTGRPPFAGATVADTLRAVRDDEPLRPRLLNSGTPVDLETICLKCLEKEPARRYATAQDLADELDRFLNDEPIHARPTTRAERVLRWCRRKPVVASLTASSAFLLLAVAIGAPIAAFRINQERLLTRQSLYSADMRLASQAVHEGAFDHARKLLDQHRPRRGSDDLRGFEWRYLWQAVRDSEPIRTLEGLPAPSGWEITSLSRSGRFLYNQSFDQLRVWDMTTWEPVPIVPPPQPASVQWRWDPSRESAYAVDNARHTLAVYTLPKFEPGLTLHLPGPMSVVAMSQDRHALAVGCQDGGSHRVLVWDLARNARIGALGDFQTAISKLVFSRDGTLLAASSTNGVVGIWNLKTLQPLAAPPSNASQRWGLEFTPDNKRLLSGNDANLSAWDIGARKTLALKRTGEVDPQHFGFTPDAMHLVVSWDGSDLTLLDSQTLQIKGTMRGDRGLGGGIAFSPDGTLIACNGLDQTACIWDMATHTEVGIVGGFGETICDVEFSADGHNIVLIGGFGQVRVHKLSSVLKRGLFAKIPGQKSIIDQKLSPDERHLASISVDGTLTLWDRHSRRPIRSVSFPRYLETSFPRVAFSPDGERVAWVTGDALRIMLVESGEISTAAMDGNHEISPIAFSPNGRELAFGCGKQVLIYELNSKRQQRFTATDDQVFAIEYSPDGARIAFGDRQGTVTLCDRSSGKGFSKVKAHPPHVYGVAMSPDGKLLATCGADASIKLWRVEPDGLRLQATLLGHMGYVGHVAFSPDGTRLVSACRDKTLKIWDPRRAAELGTLYGHHDMVVPVEFTKDGRTIYSAGLDGEIHFWDAPSLAEIDLLDESTPIQSIPGRSNELK